MSTVQRAGGAVSAGGRLGPLDGFRGVAILLVVTGHGLLAWQVRPPAFLAVLSDGTRGVTVFFVLSGFLITTILLRERDRTGTISLRAFYSRRFLRILPAFYVFLAVVGVLAITGSLLVPFGSWLASALFVWNYAPIERVWWLGHTWSLAVEEQFYLLWPLVLIHVPHRRLRRIALGVICAMPVVRVAEYIAVPSLRDDIAIQFHTRMDAPLIGALLAMTVGTPMWSRLVPWVGRLWPVAALWLFVAGPVLGERFAGAYFVTVGWSLEQVCAAVLLAAVIATPTGALGRALSIRPLRLLGLISYSLYLWQQLFLTPLLPDPWRLPWVGLPLALAAATASYWGIEKPFLRLKRRFERA